MPEEKKDELVHLTIDGNPVARSTGNAGVGGGKAGGHRGSDLLLSSEDASVRRLPYVLCRDREDAEATADSLYHTCRRGDGRAYRHREGTEGAARHPGVFTDQSSARLSDL